MRLFLSLITLLTVLLNSCGILRPKYLLTDGRYASKVMGKNVQPVYVENKEEAIHVYPLRKAGQKYYIDTSNHNPLIFLNGEMDSISVTPTFRQYSFDIDFLTIPFKFRFPSKGFPPQFNANLNGGVYMGYRTDSYVLRYHDNPLHISKRNITHFGFSFGGYMGLGGTAMNPWVTNDQLTIEYDGVVWTKGVAGIIALNNFTTGLALGWDHLLDNNKKYWIYQGKPWIGFVFGLNIN